MQAMTDDNHPISRSVGDDSASAPIVIDGEKLPVREADAVIDFDPIDALVRLLVGGSAELSDLLLQQLEQWESNIATRQEAIVIEESEDIGDLVRYLLIGLAFESQRQFRSSVGDAGSWLLGAASNTIAVTRPVTRSRIFSPARRGLNAFNGRVESELTRLVRIGRSEEFVGRLVAEEAAQESIDWLLDYLAKKPEIRDLVQQQSIGFAEEVAVGTRARAITADNMLESIFRRLLGRTPRASLPGPPEVVQQQADPVRGDKGLDAAS
jgi:hypothetical protein